jgi:hypothetical protein
MMSDSTDTLTPKMSVDVSQKTPKYPKNDTFSAKTAHFEPFQPCFTAYLMTPYHMTSIFEILYH